jgi:hypothetical protein
MGPQNLNDNGDTSDGSGYVSGDNGNSGEESVIRRETQANDYDHVVALTDSEHRRQRYRRP